MVNNFTEKNEQVRITVGDILRTIRETRNISIRAVSRASGVSELTIQKIERNMSNGSIDTLIKLCAFYEIGMEDLTFWATEEQDNNVNKAKDMLYRLFVNSISKRVEKKITDFQGNLSQN